MTSARIPFRLAAGITLVLASTLSIFAQSSGAPSAAAASPAPAQNPATPPAPAGPGHPYTGPMWPTSVHIFPLSNTTTQQEQTEILTAIRNINDPRIKIMLAPSSNTIMMAGTDDQIALAQKIIEALDKPARTYRITYTLIDLDGTKRLGDQHYSMVLVPGQRAILTQGNKVPIITGIDFKNPNNPQSQISYVDLGLRFEATLDDSLNSLRLKTKVEQSSLLEDRSGTVAQDPVIRQSVFEGSAILKPGKSLIIGSLDISGSTRRIEIQANIDPIAQ